MSLFRRTTASRHWAWLVVGVVVLYLLGVGPATILGHREPAALHEIRLLYFPLEHLPRGLKDIVCAYGDFWRRATGTVRTKYVHLVSSIWPLED